jgi:hypothetical protein
LLPLVAAGDHMVEGSLELDSRSTRHAQTLSNRLANVNKQV